MLESIEAVKGRRRVSGRALAGTVLLVALLASSVYAADPPAAASGADVALVSWPTPIGDVRYLPGQGLHLGDTHLTLGGYSNVNLVRDEGSPALLKLDDLSLFVIWDPLARLHIFSELEFEDLVQVDGDGQWGNPDYQFTAERLYGDLALSDAVSIRVGKFLTPVGRWNVIHAQPLVWTTSRPLVTEVPFDPHTTGAMVFGTLFPGANTLTYELYGQATNQLDPTPTSHPADRSGGGRLEYSAWPGWSIGASYLAAEDHGAWRYLGGVDGLYQRDRFEVMGEAVVQDGEQRTDAVWGLYLQGVVETLPNLYVVGRYEHWDPWDSGRASDLFVGGLAYKPYPWLVLKAEYLAADHPVDESPPGFKSSIAILF